jgi:hypothetical protein
MVASTSAISQSDTARRETTVIFFGSEREAEKSNSKYDANAVKLGIFEMIQGMYGLSYERELSDIFTVQGGLGLTGRNWTYGLMGADGLGPGAEDQKSTYFGDNDYTDEDYDYRSRKAKMGYYVTVMPKFYYADEDGMDGSYLALNFQHRRYNYEAFGTVNSYAEFTSGNNIKEFENQTILSLAWGSQNLNDKTAIDYHIAAGIRSINGERRDLGNDANGGLVIAPSPRKTSGSYFFLEIGLKVGLWWKNK